MIMLYLQEVGPVRSSFNKKKVGHKFNSKFVNRQGYVILRVA